MGGGEEGKEGGEGRRGREGEGGEGRRGSKIKLSLFSNNNFEWLWYNL